MLSITSLTKNIVNFKEYEEKVLEMSKKVGSNTIKEQLRIIDEYILRKRNKKIFRCKGLKRFDFKTTLAEVEIYRRVYVIDENMLEEMKNKENNWLYTVSKSRLEKGLKTIYILDEMLKLKQFGKFSQGVVELMIEHIQDNSYRKTARIINEITGLNITGTSVWSVIQTIGGMLKEKEKYEEELSENDQIECKNKDNHILFSEQDGVYFTLQGKDRQESKEKYLKSHPELNEAPKSVRKKELKIVTIYEGWKKVGKKRNSIINKKIFAQVIDNISIKEKSKTYIKNNYDKETLKLIIKNSDGGTWTKEKSDDKTIYQIDYFHIKQMINRQIREKEDKAKMIKILESKEYLKILEFAEELKYKYDGEVKEIEKLKVLQEYINKNIDNLGRYQDSEKFKKIKQEGFKYNNLGIQESTNYANITRRMKRRRMSFSILGADNLSRVIALKGSYDYVGISKEFDVQILPKKVLDEAEEYINKIELDIKKQKEKSHMVKKIKYNDSFSTSIPGIEIKADNSIFKIRNILFG